MPETAPTKIKSTQGKTRVKYIDARGKSFDAIVIAAGTSSGKKIQFYNGPSRTIVDNVALKTSVKQTGVYSSR